MFLQVIRSGDNHTFFAPSKYLEVTDVSIDTMKTSLRKKMAHQRHLQNEQRLLEESRKRIINIESHTSREEKGSPTSFTDVPVSFHSSDTYNNSQSKERGVRSPLLNNSSFLQNDLIDPPRAFLDANKNESTKDSISTTNTHTVNARHATCESHFQMSTTTTTTTTTNISSTSMLYSEQIDEPSENHLNESIESFSESLQSTSVCEKSSISSTPEKHIASSELDSVSTHTSKSSLNDASRSSIESFSHLKMRCHMVGKAASFDVLQSEDEEVISSLNGTHPKAASSEELDRENQRKEFLFQSDRLCQRNRSNSVDLKRFDNNLDLSECEKLTSLEKTRKCRLARDPMNRRRSWALNESYSLSSFYKSTAGEQDASVILDAPPKLPPKMKKNSRPLSSSTDNLQQAEMSVEIKLEQEEDARQKINEEKFLWGCTSSFCPDPHTQITLQQDSLGKKKNQPVALPRKVVSVDSSQEAEHESKNQSIPEEDLCTNAEKALEQSNGCRKVSVVAEVDTKTLKSMFEEMRHEEEHKESFVEKEMEALKEKRVEELIERIENKTKSVENALKGKPLILVNVNFFIH